MAFRSSSLFSLQPSQGGGLSEFARYGADLPKTGSMQDFIDPSLTDGENLPLTGTEEPLDLSTLQQGEGGELVSSVTGARIPGQTNPEAPTSGARVPKVAGETGEDEEGASALAIAKGAFGAAKSGLSTYETLRGMFGGQAPDTDAKETQFGFKATDVDWESPDAVASWLSTNPEAQYSLFGQEVGQSPQEIGSWLQKTGDYDLGDTQLDASAFDQYDGGTSQTITDPNTGTQINIPQTAATIASTVGALTGLAGTITGSKELNIAGKATSALVSAATGNYAGAVQAIVGLAIEAAGKGADRDAQAAMQILNATMIAVNLALSSTVVGAVLASVVNTAMTIYSGIESGESDESLAARSAFASTPLGLMDIGGGISEQIGEAFLPSKHWRHFVPGLMQDAMQQGRAFGVLGQALPYVQSKEELGNLLNSYRNYLGTTTGVEPENWGSIEGAPGDVYSIGKIPGVGPAQHGVQTTPIDWAQPTQALMRLVQEIYPRLPGEPITARYGEPGGGLETPEERLRLWDQFIQGGGTLQPRQLAQEYPGRFEDLASVYDPYYMNFGQTPLSPEITGRAETNVQSLMTAARESEARRRAEEDLAMRMWMEQQASNSIGGM